MSLIIASLLAFFSAIFSAALAAQATDAQSDRVPEFRGCITYSIEFEVSETSPPRSDLEAQYGNQVIRCFGRLGYRVDYSGKSGTLWYLSRANKEYQRERGASELSVIDGSKVFLPVASSRVEDSTVLVLGHKLSVFALEFADGSEERLWFTRDLPMDPTPYADYRFAGTDQYFKSAHAAFLIYEWVSTRGYVRRDKAVSIEQGEPDEVVFRLPEIPQRSWPK